VTNTLAVSTVEYAYGALMTGTPDDDMSAIETHSPQEARLIYDGAYVISHINITLVTCAQPFYPQGNPDFWMTRESLQMARDAFCSWISSHKNANRGSIEYPWSVRVEDPIVIRRSELLGSDCDKNTPQGAWSEDLCKSTIDRIIDGCKFVFQSSDNAMLTHVQATRVTTASTTGKPGAITTMNVCTWASSEVLGMGLTIAGQRCRDWATSTDLVICVATIQNVPWMRVVLGSLGRPGVLTM